MYLGPRLVKEFGVVRGIDMKYVFMVTKVGMWRIIVKVYVNGDTTEMFFAN